MCTACKIEPRLIELTEMIQLGWGNVCQDKIPSNWRDTLAMLEQIERIDGLICETSQDDMQFLLEQRNELLAAVERERNQFMEPQDKRVLRIARMRLGPTALVVEVIENELQRDGRYRAGRPQGARTSPSKREAAATAMRTRNKLQRMKRRGMGRLIP